MRGSRLVVLVAVFSLAAGGLYWGVKASTATAPSPILTEWMQKVEESGLERDPNDLLPDLVPLPPRDLTVTRREDGATLLLFSATYFNQGEGPLELVADPATRGIREDIERNVFQQVYRREGEPREKLVGTFLWHQEHLHYHFSDFIIYDLEPVDAPAHPDLEGARVKSTFCLRDISQVDLPLANRAPEAAYLICYKEVQGVSVGWGDTYFHNYPDQNLNISNLVSGTYRLTFVANPERMLDESNLENNISSTLFHLDMKKGEVQVLSETPSDAPEVEHVYPEQPFGDVPQP